MPSHLEELQAALDRLAALLQAEEDGSKAASLSRELRALHSEIAELDKSKAGSKLDELAARRASRTTEASGPDAADAGK